MEDVPMTNANAEQQSLIERLAGELPELELLPLCSALADLLLREGWTAEAARWRTFSLIPSTVSEREEALEQARVRLGNRPDSIVPESLTAADLTPGWRDLLEYLRQNRHAPIPQQLLRDALLDVPPPEPVQLGMADLCLALDHDMASQLILHRLVANTGLAPSACNRLGLLAFRQGNNWLAERWFRTSLHQDVNQAVVWFELSRVLRLQRQHDEALEAAEAGLGFRPDHPWGLKLRVRILLEIGGWRTLQALEELGALPDDDDLRTLCHRSPLQRKSIKAFQSATSLGLGLRIKLRQVLQDLERIEVIYGRRLSALLWAHHHDLLPAGLPVQPWASRDPLAVSEQLLKMGLSPESERGLWSAESSQVPAACRLIVLERPSNLILPKHLWRLWLRDAFVFQPVGLTFPLPGHVSFHSQQGWELLIPS
ncbi:MAG: hypothetical protein ACODUE_09330 [Synechococcus sp.]